MDQRTEGTWMGWGGVAVWLLDWWFTIRIVTGISFFMWGCVMALGALMCVYGARNRSRWFYIPAVLAAFILVALPYSALRPERW
jgi:hypothetical protein